MKSTTTCVHTKCCYSKSDHGTKNWSKPSRYSQSCLAHLQLHAGAVYFLPNCYVELGMVVGDTFCDQQNRSTESVHCALHINHEWVGLNSARTSTSFLLFQFFILRPMPFIDVLRWTSISYSKSIIKSSLFLHFLDVHGHLVAELIASLPLLQPFNGNPKRELQRAVHADGFYRPSWRDLEMTI